MSFHKKECHEQKFHSRLESHAAMELYRSARLFKLASAIEGHAASKFARVRSIAAFPCKIRRPGSACTVFFSYVASKICHKIQNPKSPNSKIQNPQNPKSPKSKIPKIQNPPNLGRWGPHIKICYITVQNPKSKIPKIQNPKSPKSPRSKIQNPKSPNPKSKIPQIQNPKSPKSKIPEIWGHIKSCYITVQNPKSKIPKIGQKSLDFGFWIGDFGFLISAPKSKIQNPQDPKSPKSKIPKIQNLKSPRSKIQNPQNPKSSAKIQNLGRWGPHIKICYITIQNPKSKNPKIQKLGILDFGFGGFWILDLGDFGFWIWGILDLGDFGFWILGLI